VADQSQPPAEIRVREGAEEFALGDGPVGALLVHGFTGSPQGLRQLGEHLSARGIAVKAPRLPGHGTTWQDLNTKKHRDWIDAVEHGFFTMAAERRRTFLIGLSFGAALCLDIASRYPDKVEGVVALAAYVHTPDRRRHLAPIIRRVTRSLPGVANDIADGASKEIAYDRVPTGAAHSMLQFLKRVRLGLPSVTCPVLIIHSRNDHTAHPSNAELVSRSIGSDDKEIIWLERSYHVITLDLDRDEVFERTYDFIREHSGNAL
jgi:carboxylesterase